VRVSGSASLARRAAVQPSSPGESKDATAWDRSESESDSHADIISAKMGVPPSTLSVSSAGCSLVWKKDAVFAGLDL
jgi:hypothetical protein